jgi:diacylglycerol kinase (ATP)
MLARTAVGTASKSPFAQTTKAHSVKVKLNRKVLYELDGGDRTKVKAFKAKVEAGAITVCVPGSGSSTESERSTIHAGTVSASG